LEDLDLSTFRESFRRILAFKESSGLEAVLDNPPDLLERAKLYTAKFRNGALG